MAEPLSDEELMPETRQWLQSPLFAHGLDRVTRPHELVEVSGDGTAATNSALQRATGSCHDVAGFGALAEQFVSGLIAAEGTAGAVHR